MAPISPSRYAQLPQAISEASKKQEASRTHHQKLDVAQKSFDELEPQLKAAKGELDTLQAQFDKAPPAKQKKLAAGLEAAKAKHAGLKTKFDDVDVQLYRLKKNAGIVQIESFAAQRNANVLAKELKLEIPFPLVDGFESFAEVKSMSPEKFREAIGGAATGKRSVESQVGALKADAKTQAGPQTLADKLKNADIAAQKAILDSSSAEIDLIATRVSKGYSKDAMAYGDAMKALHPSLRGQMVKALASKIQVSEAEAYAASRDDSNVGFATALKTALKSGTGAELLGPLITELKARGNDRAAKTVATEASEAIRDLRADFSKKSAVTNDLQGDLARMMYGFKDSLSKDQLSAGIAAFKARHTNEFAALDKSVGTAMEIVKALETLPTEYGDLKAQAGKLAADVPKLLATNAGAAELKKAVKAQVLGNPNLLDTITSLTGDGKALAGFKGDLAGIAVNAAAAVALEGGGITKTSVVEFLKRNKGLLGVDSKKATELAGAMKAWDPDNEASKKALDAALKDVAPETGKALKGLNVLLAIPGAIQGWKNFGDAELDAKLKTLVGTGQLGVDTSQFLISAFNKSESLAGMGKSLASAGKVLGAASSVLDGVSAIKNFADGKIADGAADSMSAVGGLMMLGGPAGIATGAALVLGSFVVKKIWGSDPAEEAEVADEKDAKAFLEGAGLSPKVAGALSDVLQSDRRNVGTFITQVAKEFKMTPAQFLTHLEKNLDAKQLDSLVKMVKSMPVDKDWNYAPAKGDKSDTSKDRARIGAVYVGPKSIPTAVEWIKAQKMAPALRN